MADPFDNLDFVARDVPLAPMTWYKLGGPARHLVRPRSIDELADALRRCREHGVPFHVLGKGCNLLVADDGVPGAVFRLDAPAFASVDIDGPTVRAGAGADLQKLLLQTVRAGLSGIETLGGIPASVGGAARMNAGGRYGDFGSAVASLTVMDAGGNAYERTRDDLIWDYRRVNVVAPLVLSATLDLEPADPDELGRRYKEVWMAKRNSQPLNAKSAGCVFKNPPATGDGTAPSAGALIDRAGLKGTRVGGAQVSDVHANFFVAHAGCTAADVVELIDLVRDAVLERCGVQLTMELERWP